MRSRRIVWVVLSAVVMAGWPVLGQVRVEPNVYVWNDAGREMRATLVEDDDRLVRVGSAATVGKVGLSPHEARMASVVESARSAGLPVFRQAGGAGPLMIPAGGVLVRMLAGVDAAAFFAREGLEYEPRGVERLYFVHSDAGWASLELASRLDEIGAVELAVPNWWRERSAQVPNMRPAGVRGPEVEVSASVQATSVQSAAGSRNVTGDDPVVWQTGVGNGATVYFEDPGGFAADRYRVVVSTANASYGTREYSAAEIHGDDQFGRYFIVPNTFPYSLRNNEYVGSTYTLTGIDVENAGAGYAGTVILTISGDGGPTHTVPVEPTTGSVAEITVTNGGSGYTSVPDVTIEGGGGSGAAAASVLHGSVGEIVVESGGSEYASVPTVEIVGGGGSGATATATVDGVVGRVTIEPSSYGWYKSPGPTITFEGGGGSGAAGAPEMHYAEGEIETITVTNGGSGYTTAPTVSMNKWADYAPEEDRAQLEAVISNGTVTEVRVTSGGDGYRTGYWWDGVSGDWLPHAVTFDNTGTDGSGAQASVGSYNLYWGDLRGIKVTSNGSGYTSAPTIVLGHQDGDAGIGTHAAATAVLDQGLGAVTVTNGGSGYTSQPEIRFSGGGGSGAAATSVLHGSVGEIVVESGGNGYTSAPTITIAAPASGVTATADTTVEVGALPEVALPDTAVGSTYNSEPVVELSGGGSGSGAVVSAQYDTEASDPFSMSYGHSYDVDVLADYGEGWSTATGWGESATGRRARYFEPSSLSTSDSAFVIRGNSSVFDTVDQSTDNIAYPFAISATDRVHWFRFRNGVLPTTLRFLVSSSEIADGDLTAKLYGSDKYTDAVDLENEVEFTLGEWALRSETLVTEYFGDRFNSWFIQVELAEDATGGLYVFDAQTRPDLSQDHRTTREEILAEDPSLLGALLPREGGSVQGYFENEWDSYGGRWAETDPYYIVTPEGDGFDALIWVEGDALFDTWMKLWKCCDLNEDVLWEPDNPAAVLTDDTGFYPGWYRGDERSNLEARGRNQLSVMRLQLDADTAYLLWAWNVHAFTSYKMNFVQVEEPGDTAATAVSLSPDRQYEKVRGGNIGEATDVDYFKLVLDRERELMIRAVAADGVLALVGGIYTGEGGSDAFPAAHVAHDRFTNDQFYYTTAPAYRVGNGFTIQHTFPAGTYYVKVEGDGANTGAYYIAVENDLAVPEEWDCVDSDDQYPDPLWGCQFTLKNDDEDGLDLNIVPAWEAGAAGTGVRVRVVDGSFDAKSIELVDNVVAATDHSDSEKGTVLNPFPGIGYSHGTASAAVIAARDNGLGMRGIAPRAQLSLHNAIDFPTDDIVIRSLSYNEGDDLIADVGLMSHSWGVFQGRYVNLETSLVHAAFEVGLTSGNGGRGVSHFQAVGNDYLEQGYSTLDEIQNHIGIIQICAVNDKGRKSWFSEQGSNLWVCGIVTREQALGDDETYWDNYSSPSASNFGHFVNFSGTSSATPHVAGVGALLHEANPNLGWRDVKLILAATAHKTDPLIADERVWWWDHPNRGVKVPVSHREWMLYSEGGALYGDVPAAGRYTYSHRYGFGVVDANAAVSLAKVWPSGLPRLRTEEPDEIIGPFAVHDDLPYPGEDDNGTVVISDTIEFVEWVDVYADFHTDDFRDLRIVLTAPSGSTTLLSHPYDECWAHYGYPEGSENGTGDCEYPGSTYLEGEIKFGSARFLGEDPEGTWALSIVDEMPHGSKAATLESWRLVVHGHSATLADDGDDGDDGDGDDTGDDGDVDGDGDSRTDGGDADEPRFAGTCAPDDTTLCLQNNRFEVRMLWKVEETDVPRWAEVVVGRQGAGIFSFGDDDDWMILSKALDGCDITGAVWLMHSVSFADPGDVAVEAGSEGQRKALPIWSITYRDTVAGESLSYGSPAPEWSGNRTMQTRATVNRSAFRSACGLPAAAAMPVKVGGGIGRDVDGLISMASAAVDNNEESATTLHDRFKVSVDWRTWDDVNDGFTGEERRRASVPVTESSDSSAAFYWHNPDNIEVMVKVTDMCNVTSERSRYYVVQVSGATLDGFQARVEDLWSSGDVRFYRWWENEGMGSPPLTNVHPTAATLNKVQHMGLGGNSEVAAYRFSCRQ